MDPITIKQIDEEHWRFILYEGPEKEWYLKVPYSPTSFVDTLMIFQLTEEEKLQGKKDRANLIGLAEHVQNHFRDYFGRARKLDEFIYLE